MAGTPKRLVIVESPTKATKIAGYLGDGVRPRLEPQVRGLPSGRSQEQPSHPHFADAQILEVGKPLPVRRMPLGIARQPCVGQPHLYVGEDVKTLALDHPAVQPGALHPAAEPFLPGDTVDDGPVREQLQAAPGFQVARSLAHDGLDETIGHQVALAVGEPLAAGRAHDVGRVRDDQVKELARDGFEQGPLPEIDSGPAQLRTDARELEGPGIEVRGHHVVGVPDQVERLHTAPGPKIQRPTNRLAHRDLRERQGGGGRTEHVVRAGGARDLVESRGQVADEVTGGAVVRGTVGADVDERPHRVTVDHQPPGVRGFADVERRRCRFQRHVLLEDEQPHQTGQRIHRAVQRHVGGDGAVAAQPLLAMRPDPPQNVVGGVVRQREEVTEVGACHGPRLGLR